MAKKQWIKGAIEEPGGLHRSLGVPEGQPIGKKRIAKAASQGGKVGKQARLAQMKKEDVKATLVVSKVVFTDNTIGEYSP